MSASVSTATLFPEWKQEVNRRVAAHLSRKTSPSSEPETSQESRMAPASRAARAAARVAARYANAPSYNQMLAGEARAAVRAAQVASRAAREAHAAAQYVLAGLEAASSPEPDWEPELQPAHAPKPQPELVVAPAPPPPPESILFHEARQAAAPEELARPAQPVYANLIQFPREMIATRRMRPRLAEGPLAAVAAQEQLSIFEVDPGTVSTQPAPVKAGESAAPAWMRTEWPSIALEAQPQEELLEEPEPQALAPAVELAPLSRRLLAIVVDNTLIAAAFMAAAAVAAFNAAQLPGLRAVEVGAVLALLIVAAAYHLFFFTLARATPGMRYAGIVLSTMEGCLPTRARRWGRLLSQPLSILPLGLGFAWALFDDGHLTWHDRLSRTYLRKR